MDTSSYRLDGRTVFEHRLSVPLDHAAPHGEKITLFARELVRDGGEGLPALVYLQGGPGNRANRPEDVSGWIARASYDAPSLCAAS